MRRRPVVPVLAAAGLVLGLAGCGGWGDGTPSSSASSASSASSGTAVSDRQVADVGAAVDDAEQVLGSIDAELAADAASDD